MLLLVLNTLVAFAATTNTAFPTPNASDPTEAIVIRLRDRVRMLYPAATPRIDGPTLVMADGALRVTTEVKAVLRDGTDWIVDATFDVRVDGPRGGTFEHTTVGIGESRGDADRSVADDWMSSLGFPLLAAFYAEAPVRVMGRYSVYAGLPGSQATVPVAWMDGSDPLHAQILDAVEHTVRTEAASTWTTLSVLHMNRPGEPSTTDCFVGRHRSESCQATLNGIRWPVQSGPFLLKQMYVLRRDTNAPDG